MSDDLPLAESSIVDDGEFNGLFLKLFVGNLLEN